MQLEHLKKLRTLAVVLACGALAAGCAGNSVKPDEQQTAVTTSSNTDQALVEADNHAIEQPVASEPANPLTATDDTNETSTQAMEDKPKIESDVTPASEQPKQVSFYFGFNKSELDTKDIDVLKQHARFLKDNPMLVLEINGHTDSSGPHAYNEYLSKQRAEAVAKVLITEGVTRSQLVINALAEGKPLAEASSPGKNRRVDLQYDEVNMVSTK